MCVSCAVALKVCLNPQVSYECDVGKCRCPGAGKWVEGDGDSRASYAQRTQVLTYPLIPSCTPSLYLSFTYLSIQSCTPLFFQTHAAQGSFLDEDMLSCSSDSQIMFALVSELLLMFMLCLKPSPNKVQGHSFLWLLSSFCNLCCCFCICSFLCFMQSGTAGEVPLTHCCHDFPAVGAQGKCLKASFGEACILLIPLTSPSPSDPPQPPVAPHGGCSFFVL